LVLPNLCYWKDGEILHSVTLDNEIFAHSICNQYSKFWQL
jgi:hypothetical protein